MKLTELRDSNQSRVDPAVFESYIDQILAMDRMLAVIAIDDAKARGGNASKIKVAEAELAKGDAEAGRAHPDKVIGRYKNSWTSATAA